MGAALPFLEVGSAIFGAIGAVRQGDAAAGAANYNAQEAANNAKIATQNADWAGAEGEAKVEQQQLKTRSEAGALKANEAAGGIDVNSGSPVDVRSSAAELGELNAITIRSDAARQAYGFQTESASDTGQSELDKSQASNDKTAGYINAASTLLAGAAKADEYGNLMSSQSVSPSSVSWNNDISIPNDGQYYPGG